MSAQSAVSDGKGLFLDGKVLFRVRFPTGVLASDPANLVKSNVQISFSYLSKAMTFNRKAADTLDVILKRMSLSCGTVAAVTTGGGEDTPSAESSGGKKGKRQVVSATIENVPIQFLDEGSREIPQTVTLCESLGLVRKITVGSQVYETLVDPLEVEELEVATDVVAGFPAVCSLKLVGGVLTQHGLLSMCPSSGLQRTSSVESGKSTASSEEAVRNAEARLAGVSVEWFLESESDKPDTSLEVGYVFHVPRNLLGRSVYAVASVESTGQKLASNPVVVIDRESTFKIPAITRPWPRQEEANNNSTSDARMTFPGSQLTFPSSIRVCSYNILAQGYLRTPLAVDTYYRHLTEAESWDSVSWRSRAPILLREFDELDADVFLLQELAEDMLPVVKSFLSPKYWFYYAPKPDKMCNKEGVAICVRKSFGEVKFTSIDCGTDAIKKGLNKDEIEWLAHKYGAAPWEQLNGIKSGAATGLIKLSDPSGRTFEVLVATCHLFFHPNGGFMRLLQMDRILKEINQLIPKDGHVILGGDFNSTRGTAVMTLLTQGGIEPWNPVWSNMASFRYVILCDMDQVGKSQGNVKESEWTGLSLVNKRKMFVHEHQMPQTHATMSFKGAIDHIVSTIPEIAGSSKLVQPRILSEEVLSTIRAIPADSFPSDHVPIVAEIPLPKF